MTHRSSLTRAHGRSRTRRSYTFLPALEALEDRVTPTGLGWAIDADPQPNLNSINNWGLALDGNNDSIITGPFTGTTTVGNKTLTSAGSEDGYIAKYYPDGSFAWAEGFGGTGDDIATRVAADAGGNIYVAGYFASATATFGNLTETNSTGYKAAFVAKLDPSGNFLWVTPFSSTTGDDSTWGIAVDGSGNVYATGYFTGTTQFGSTTLNSAGGASVQNIFVTKLDAATGTPVWARGMGGTIGNNWGLGVVPDSLGNVYVTGRFSSTSTSPATFGSFSLTSKSGTNAFVTRLDSSGNFQWTQRMGGEGNTINQAGYGIAIDDRAADPTTWAVYVTGVMNGNSCDFGSTTFTTYGTDSPGSGNRDDSFVAKLDATTGSFTWADQLGGVAQEYSYAIAVDGSGNVYTAGGFGANNQSANFDPHGTFIMYPGDGVSAPGSGSLGNPVQSNYRDAYVSLLDPNGNFLAAWQTTAQATDHNGADGIAADSAGDLWVSGGFDEPTAFPNGQMLTSNGTGWVFLMRLNAPHGAVAGTVYADLNNNGTRDAEPALSGRTVYVDLNNNGAIDPGEPSAVSDIHGRYEINGLAPGAYTIRPVLPAGWTTTAPAGGAYTVTVGSGFARNNDFGEYTPTTQTTYAQSKATTIKGRTTVQSTISVPDTYSLLDLDVNVNISYSADGLLSLYLIAPDGTTVPLWIENASSGSNFTNTTFDDQASVSITGGTAPFTGHYQAPWLLAALQGKSVKGTWTLEVVNNSTTTGKINSWSLIAKHATSSPQLSALGVAPGGEAAAPALTPAELAPVAREAVAQWAATGLTAPQVALLNRVQFSIQDLSGGGDLGLTALNTPKVLLDATAVGWGWFIDPTPADNAEFTVPAGGQEQQALPGSPAYGHMDLLTVVEHELGHVLGLDDENPDVAAHDLMTATLGTGARRLLTPAKPAPLPGLSAAESRTAVLPALPPTERFTGAPLGATQLPSAPSALDRYFASLGDWEGFAGALGIALERGRKN